MIAPISNVAAVPTMVVIATILLAVLGAHHAPNCDAFEPAPPTSNNCRGRLASASESALRIALDPSIVDAGIAVVSAAAGAATQLPRIHQLEREVKAAKDSLVQSEQELVSKIASLEDKLFHMDQEYEQATARFKKQYDTSMKEELERIAEKMKVDFQYKLEIRLEEQKSKLLGEQLSLVNGLTGGRQEELVDLRLRNSRVQKANEALEKALVASKLELERMQVGAQKKVWWPF
jgi:hypothetical protein